MGLKFRPLEVGLKGLGFRVEGYRFWVGSAVGM